MAFATLAITEWLCTLAYENTSEAAVMCDRRMGCFDGLSTTVDPRKPKLNFLLELSTELSRISDSFARLNESHNDERRRYDNTRCHREVAESHIGMLLSKIVHTIS